MHSNLSFKFLLYFPFLLTTVDLWARAGGGGGGGGGGRGGRASIIELLILLPLAIISGWIVNQRIRNKHQKVKTALNEIEKREPQWSEEKLVAMARAKFLELQAAWGNQDLTFLMSNLWPDIFNEWKTQIKSQIAENKRNVLTDISIHESRIVDLQNFKENHKDTFTVCFDVYANDQTLKENGKFIEEKKENFREFWTFKFSAGEWKLFSVAQENSWRNFINSPIVDEK